MARGGGAGFGVILADPPWDYNNRSNRGAARRQYPTLPDEAICALPVAELARPDTVLLLWATWPRLEAAIQVINAWGFRYMSGFPWLKLTEAPRADLLGELWLKFRLGVGWWIRGVSEPVLIGVRENARPAPAPPPGVALDPDIGGLATIRFEHSQKPIQVHEYGERWPGPYLELFARRPRPGWQVWGNEVDRIDQWTWPGIREWSARWGSDLEV